MTRHAAQVSTVTYSLTRAEVEQAVRDYVVNHTALCGTAGLCGPFSQVDVFLDGSAALINRYPTEPLVTP